MRRGRIFAAAAVLAVMLTTAAAAVAASPQALFTHNAITQGYGGVGANTTPPVANQKPVTEQVAGAQKTQQRTAGAAPASHVGGTLPFTGAQLGVFALFGVALIGGGLLVRRVGRRSDA